MRNQLVECIPNFSEGRRLEVITAIIAAIRSVDGIAVLDRHSDVDHNRSVITFAGDLESVEEAAFQATLTAARLINMEQHRGQHPRIGATDVIPLVPLLGVSMNDCVTSARHLGQRIASELDLPVYLYEKAALSPERSNLTYIRKGEYEQLKDLIGNDAKRKPDFGPCQLGTAGAVAVGARLPLIAFNVYLNTPDVRIAKNIARKIRQSSGGLPSVKALGFFVGGYAQVSINLINFEETSLAKVLRLIMQEAFQEGTSVHHSELVGLIPQEAINQATAEFLSLFNFKENQILENRLEEQPEEWKVKFLQEPFLEQLSSQNPVPAGGSAAAYSAAMAAALICKVARITCQKSKDVDKKERMQSIQNEAEEIKSRMQELVVLDQNAYRGYLQARRLPHKEEAEKILSEDAIIATSLIAARIPLEICQAGIVIMQIAETVITDGIKQAAADGMAAVELTHSAISISATNVRENLKSIQNEESQAILAEVALLEQKDMELAARLKVIFKERTK